MVSVPPFLSNMIDVEGSVTAYSELLPITINEAISAFPFVSRSLTPPKLILIPDELSSIVPGCEPVAKLPKLKSADFFAPTGVIIVAETDAVADDCPKSLVTDAISMSEMQISRVIISYDYNYMRQILLA